MQAWSAFPVWCKIFHGQSWIDGEKEHAAVNGDGEVVIDDGEVVNYDSESENDAGVVVNGVCEACCCCLKPMDLL